MCRSSDLIHPVQFDQFFGFLRSCLLGMVGNECNPSIHGESISVPAMNQGQHRSDPVFSRMVCVVQWTYAVPSYWSARPGPSPAARRHRLQSLGFSRVPLAAADYSPAWRPPKAPIVGVIRVVASVYSGCTRCGDCMDCSDCSGCSGFNDFEALRCLASADKGWLAHRASTAWDFVRFVMVSCISPTFPIFLNLPPIPAHS
jgi:hypothetical protein